jgi:hypothetical protein
MTRAVVLLSGGLDSMLAVRVLQEQGIEVEGLNFQTIFTCCKDTAAQSAHELGVRLTVVGQEDDYIELVRKPRYGYGKGANPCVDCRIYMFERARQFAQQVGADFIASGEVLGQRPMSQKRRDLAIIAQESGLYDELLRPLSALLLAPTRAERLGLVDRNRLFGFVGRGRKPLIALARHYGFKTIPSPSTGCSLTERTFAGKVHDLVQLDPDSQRWDFELLNVGRHIRIDAQTKAVVGRRESENLIMQHMFDQPESRAAIRLIPHGFSGPTVLVIGPASEENLQVAGGLIVRYAKFPGDDPQAYVTMHGQTRLVEVAADPTAIAAATL